MSLPELRDQIETHFNKSELQDLCFDLDIRYDNIPGDALKDKARELVDYCKRSDRLPELVGRCHELRPRVAWPDVFADTPTSLRRMNGANANWLLPLVGLAAIAILTIGILYTKLADLQPSQAGRVELAGTGNHRVRVETVSRVLSSGDTIQTHEVITATFRILNSDSHVITIKALIIAARGPGVSCKDKNEKKWSASDYSFPPITNVTLRPGLDYEYRGTRVFESPGAYFLEPVLPGPER